MGEIPAGSEMENDRRNPCIGCGPENPVGLRLRFWREENGVSASFVAGPHYQGWPDRLHSGILYLGLLETANWTIYATRGRVGLPVHTGALVSSRWVAGGETLTFSGRLTTSDDATGRVRAEARDAQGASVAYLDRAFEFPTRSEFLRRMGYDTVPAELEGALPSE